MIEHIKKDVTTVTHGVVGNGVNTLGIMGGGVALAIKIKWPGVFPPYERVCKAGVRDRTKLLGLCQILDITPPDANRDITHLFVANCFTQLNIGCDNGPAADCDSIEKSLDQCMSFCQIRDLPLYIPKIGCLRGGLDWEKDVEPIVERLHEKYGITIFVCDIV